MRHQERIYIQNQNSSVRNRSFNNFNMSSDMCVFNTPLFNVSGATKIDCTGSTSGATYIISANTQTIPLFFDFTANTQTFIDTEANFRYEIYKYDENQNQFSGIPIYQSEIFSYSAFSGTNSFTQFVPSSGITIDGDFLIKGYSQFNVCTTFLNLLNKKVDTINYKYGTKYGIYNNDLDYYFIAVKDSEKPNFVNNGTNNSSASSLQQSVYLPESGVSVIPLPFGIVNNFVLTLNGIVLAEGYDYSVDFTTNIVTLSGLTAPDDIITYIYATVGGPSLVTDNIDINVAINSGTTGNQGSDLVYFNTITNKYEVYLSLEPLTGTDIILMLNGATLANNVDYYQSTSNTKRLILEGQLYVGDILTIVYLPQNGTVNALNSNKPVVTWTINEAPQKNNGYFSLEVSTGNTFSTFYYTGYTEYDTNSTYYSDTFVASGTVGTTLFYRVKNTKNYETICGNIITTTAYSDIIPVTIQSNAINSY